MPIWTQWRTAFIELSLPPGHQRAREPITHLRPLMRPRPSGALPTTTSAYAFLQNLIVCSSLFSTILPPTALAASSTGHCSFCHCPASDAAAHLHWDPHPHPLGCPCHIPCRFTWPLADCLTAPGHRGTTFHSLWLRMCVGRAQRMWRELFGKSLCSRGSFPLPASQAPI